MTPDRLDMVSGYPPSARDWAEDFAHENGNYECSCVFCEQSFTGHKRRTVCKACDVSMRLEYERRFVERVQQHVTAAHTAVIAERDAARAELARLTTPRPFVEWFEEDGPVLWWREGEPPYVGTPADADGRLAYRDLFWTPIPIPRFP